MLSQKWRWPADQAVLSHQVPDQILLSTTAQQAADHHFFESEIGTGCRRIQMLLPLRHTSIAPKTMPASFNY